MDFDDIYLELNENAPAKKSVAKPTSQTAQNRLLNAIDDFDNMPAHPKTNSTFSAISSKGSRLKGAATKDAESESDDEFGLKDEKYDNGAPNEDNDNDDDFFDSDEDTAAKPTKAKKKPQDQPVATKSEPKASQLSAEVIPVAQPSDVTLDFKKFMSCSLEQQKKKNQIIE